MMAKSNYLGALAAAAGTLAAVGLLVLMLVVDARSAGAAPPAKKFTKSSTVTQSGFFGKAAGARITAAGNPYSFSKTRTIASIKQVTITVTIRDGDSALGEGDENDLLLDLDNINTGIALNGFRDNQTDRRTISGIPNQKSALKAALKADGKLEARIVDADPAEGNALGIPANDQTTLRIKGTLTR